MKKETSINNKVVLNELAKMYTTIAQSLRELIQNSFDAYCNNIYITIDIPNDFIKVIDDGTGMNDYVVENHYVNTGESTKNKTILKMPPIPDILNNKRVNIGKKGMGKLSWVLIADKQETITSSIDIPYAIKVIFDSKDLEHYEADDKGDLIHINKTFKHGTEITFTNLKISDITNEDISELENTVGFLHHSFPEFNVYLTVKSNTVNIIKQPIIKILAEGYEFKEKGIYHYNTGKLINESRTVKENEVVLKIPEMLEIPYEFVFRFPSWNVDEKIVDFWILSNYMGIGSASNLKSSNTGLKNFSGYLNIDNIELVANRNNIQTGELGKYKIIEEMCIGYVISELERLLVSDNFIKINEYINHNKVGIIDLIYSSSTTGKFSMKIGKYLPFQFYGVGVKRLVDFFEKENAIYYYYEHNKNLADKAFYYGYMCFLINNKNEEYILNRSFDTPFIVNIESIPKEAFSIEGVSIKPVGKLSDILKNMSKIFESLTKSYQMTEEEIEELEKELEEKLDKLTEEEKQAKRKELEELRETLKKIEEELDKGKEEEGETESEDEERELRSKHKKIKDVKRKSFKRSDNDYFEFIFGDRKLKVGFVHLKEKTLGGFIDSTRKYVNLNLNNRYVKDATEENDALKQLVLITPIIVHEISHLRASSHDEIFMAVYNSYLHKTLHNLLMMFPSKEEYASSTEKESVVKKEIISKPIKVLKMRLKEKIIQSEPEEEYTKFE